MCWCLSIIEPTGDFRCLPQSFPENSGLALHPARRSLTSDASPQTQLMRASHNNLNNQLSTQSETQWGGGQETFIQGFGGET